MLPDAVINRLFDRLAATYGAAWDRSLGSAPLTDVKQVWAKELSGFFDKLDAIAYGLDHLPEKVPNVLEFRALCRRAPSLEPKQLERPKVDPQRIAELAKQLRAAFGQPAQQDPKEWARKLQQRHQSGEKLGGHQIRAYREALGVDGRQSWQ